MNSYLRRNASTRWQLVSLLEMVIVPTVWAILHITFVERWSAGLSMITVLIATLIAICFSIGVDDYDYFYDRYTLGGQIFTIALVLVLGMIAGWLLSNAGIWRLVGAFLVGLENGLVTSYFAEKKPRALRRWIGYLAFIPIIFLGIVGIIEILSWAASTARTIIG
ncbi:MAG: hypothetical protein HYT83_02320 [Candidatus Levybacteria bacterium]|nr:hypothetical protein [Candidatus Levybacteria bacterium]